MKTAIEALFQAMVTDYWFTASAGDVESPTGHFAYVTNEAKEIPSILDTFKEVTDVYGVPTDEEMTGSFVVQEDSQGFFNIARYDSDTTALAAYTRLLADYIAWADESGQPEESGALDMLTDD